MINGKAFAKINLGLRVASVREDGFHPVDGIFQSVDIVDLLQLEAAEEDSIVTSSGGPVLDGLDNLAFKAARAVRSARPSSQPIVLTLDKTIPVAAGLGGGSADAAASLAMASKFFGVPVEVAASLAPTLGSDVPFCLAGGTARVSGRGEIVEEMDDLHGFVLAVVVPPVELSTPVAFRTWDEMGEPSGLRMTKNDLPPALRTEDGLINDLYPAAVQLAPELDDWRTDLSDRWSRAVMLSGSGPSLFGFFVDSDEARSAIEAVPSGSRFAEACGLSTRGWSLSSG